MKTSLKLLLLVAIDYIIIWFWVKDMDPDPSVSIGILFLVPLAFVVNLFIAGAFYFIKKDFVKLFLINSVAAAIIMYFLFNDGISRHQRETLDSWNFTKADTIFEIIQYKKINEFSITYSV